MDSRSGRNAAPGGPFSRDSAIVLETANLSKEELALKIREQVPSFSVTFGGSGTDPDKRNYIVSNDRLKQVGFSAKRGLEAGIHELIVGYRMFGRHPYKNV